MVHLTEEGNAILLSPKLSDIGSFILPCEVRKNKEDIRWKTSYLEGINPRESSHRMFDRGWYELRHASHTGEYPVFNFCIFCFVILFLFYCVLFTLPLIESRLSHWGQCFFQVWGGNPLFVLIFMYLKYFNASFWHIWSVFVENTEFQVNSSQLNL